MSIALDEPAAKIRSGAPWRRWLGQALVWIIVLDVAAVAVVSGLRLRRWLWVQSEPIRFRADVNNAFNQGSRVVAEARAEARKQGRSQDALGWGDLLKGWADRYDQLVDQRGSQGEYGLDYTPLRLLVVSAWVKHIRQIEPQADEYSDAYAGPMLKGNTACEVVAAVGMFVLVRYWVRRGQRPPTRRRARGWPWIARSRSSREGPQRPELPPGAELSATSGRLAHPHRGWIAGLVAALLLWFNPAMLVDAHAWPQWDVWLVPFFISAAVLASVNWWVGAGILLAVGSMFKGQLLLVAPVFVLWPLFEGKIGAALGTIIGAAFGTALVTWPWLIRGTSAWWWIGSLGTAAALVSPWFFRRKASWLWWVALALAAGLVLWPWMPRAQWPTAWRGLVLAAAIGVCPWLLPRRAIPAWLAMVLGAGAFVAALRFDGSFSWYSVGFDYPTRHFKTLAMDSVNNLSSIMAQRYGWTWMETAYTIPAHALRVWPAEATPLPLKHLLALIYAATLVPCSIGAAIHSRRNDPRLLISLAAPWVLFFALLAQMHERYLVWAAAITAVGAGIGLGMTLLHLLVSGVALQMILHTMLRGNRGFLPQWFEVFEGAHPDIGWMVLLCAGVYLYLAAAPRSIAARRRT